MPRNAFAKKRAKIEFTDSISRWVGSWSFFNIHIIWFIMWLIVGLPIHVLTLVVSLEAIILMILLLMQQNRQVARDDQRDEADYKIDAKTEGIVEQNKELLIQLKTGVRRLEKLLDRHDKKNS